MSSGIAINPKCISEFKGVVNREYYAILLRIGDNKEELIVDKVVKDVPGSDPEAKWTSIIKDLPANDCRFLLCDFQWKVSAASTSSKLCLVHWAPDEAPAVSKMVYAATKVNLQNQIDTQRSVQATEKDEVTYAEIKASLAK